MKLAVIGAGWAGLAAALRLQRLGHSVSVFEAGRTPGGRARRLRALGGAMDNGQHILLGAYTETLGLMRELGRDPDALLYRETLRLEAADGRFRLHAPALPAPLHLLAALWGARGLGWKDRYAIARLLAALRSNGWRVAPGLNVAQWLADGRQSADALRTLWQPLCVAALNTPMELACAQLFAWVLRDSVGGPRSASDILIPRVDLSALWPDRAAERLAGGGCASDAGGDETEQAGRSRRKQGRTGLRLGHAVRLLSCGTDGAMVDGEAFDGAIVACNTPSTLRLLRRLPPCPGSEEYLSMLGAFRFIPIATISLKLARPWGLPRPMLLLRDDPSRLRFGQWLFDKSSPALGSPAEPAGAALACAALAHIVVSDAQAMQAYPQGLVVAAAAQQAREQTAQHAPMPDILDHAVVVEKRATFAATPGLARPSNATPWPRIWVAGDWTDTGYPGVLEGAVRSGLRAAQHADALFRGA